MKMLLFQKNVHFPSNAVNVLNYVLPVVLLQLCTCESSLTALSRLNRDNHNEDHSICGTVTTSGGETVTLREGLILSPEEFEKVHVGKLHDAVFTPANSSCAIQICGHTSWGAMLHKGYIGSLSDYADCNVLKSKTVANVSEPAGKIFNSLYNTSSIACGCIKRPEECTYRCEYRVMNKIWTENECAVLYQESACNSCYLEPFSIFEGQNYSTDHSHQIRSMIVRDDCYVKQNIPALRHFWRFANVSQPIVYDSVPTSNNVKSAFLNEPEYFYCECGIIPTTEEDLPPSSTETPTTKEPLTSFPTQTPTTEEPLPSFTTQTPSEDSGSIDPIGLGVIFGMIGTTLVFTIIITGVHLLRKKRMKDQNARRGSDESNLTMNTMISAIDNLIRDNDMLELGDNRILNVPFDTAFDICEEHYQIGESLDEGHFGKVNIGTLQVAIKRVKTSCGSAEKEIAIKSLQQEMKILAHLGSHANVVRLLGAHIGDFQNGELSLIIEYCQNGSLKSYLKTKVKPRLSKKMSELALLKMAVSLTDNGCTKKSYISINNCDGGESNDFVDLQSLDPEMLQQMYKWIHQIACGMQFIQSKNIIHVDLATRNVLLNHNLVAKIGDFGLSKKIYIKDYVSSRKDSLPICWVAPESLKDYKCSAKSDVWSFGVTCWEIFNAGKDPYEDLTGLQVVTSLIFEGKRLERPQFASEDVYSKLRDCWKEEPNQRPSFENLRVYFYAKLHEKTSTCEDIAEISQNKDIEKA